MYDCHYDFLSCHCKDRRSEGIRRNHVYSSIFSAATLNCAKRAGVFMENREETRTALRLELVEQPYLRRKAELP
jgi:hypothetical protein